ncbi:MAG: gamma-glutamyltransferase, partial [Burkholderiales bacterium]
PHMAAFWDQVPTEGRAPHRDLLTSFEATRRIYVKPDGSLYRLGERVRNPGLADTLARIGEAGVEDFFRGDIADRIVADMRAHGGLLSARDLDRCRVRESGALEGRYRGCTIVTNAPPGGGATLIQMLNILENFDLTAMGHNSTQYIATVAEAMKIGAIDRERYLGDPEFVDVPLAMLLSKSYAADLAQNIRLGGKAHVPRFVSIEARDTTQACVVDAEGICVSLTHSLGTPSGVVTEGLGFMYNGAMAAFDPRPGRAGSIAPGKARTSSIAPTIVLKAGAPFLVLGAPGGTFITPGILQAILNVVDFGMNALEAVSAPRFCATSDVIGLTNRIPRAIERALVEKGYPVSRTPYNYYYAGVHAIRISEGKLDGGADPGRDGMALVA